MVDNLISVTGYVTEINQWARQMRPLILAIAFLASTRFAFALDITLKELAELIEPERTRLIACLSDVVDRSKAQGMTDTEFKETLPKVCANEREELRKAFLGRIIPALKVDDNKSEELATAAVRQLLIPIYNELSGQIPYRYRLKDAKKAEILTPEDIEFKSAGKTYSECLSKFATKSKAEGTSADDFKKSLNDVCLEEAKIVHQAELRVWETYVRPPSNSDAAGKPAISLAKMNAFRVYGKASK